MLPKRMSSNASTVEKSLAPWRSSDLGSRFVVGTELEVHRVALLGKRRTRRNIPAGGGYRWPGGLKAAVHAQRCA